MSNTILKRIYIKKFRGINDSEIEFIDGINLICGKNGTSKSSILGIVAQIFSFDKDYSSGESLKYRQLNGSPFSSLYSRHFRMSDEFDIAGSMDVQIELYDGYSDQNATCVLELMKRGKKPRPVVRKNSTSGKSNSSRNFTHPVIFLSLKRLLPIAERVYKVGIANYIEENSEYFTSLNNEILNIQSSTVTKTDGTIGSAVAHGEQYNQDSVSTGEDNIGQIIMAIMSFKKLKEDYEGYKGGIIIIDEADAGLFPMAQTNLLDVLYRECRRLDVQVIITSHSPKMIHHSYNEMIGNKKYKTIYLSKAYGSVEVKGDWSWRHIEADINTSIINCKCEERIRLYTEDREADDFLLAMIDSSPIRRYILMMDGVSLGCGNYKSLADRHVPEFSKLSIVCLDADAQVDKRHKNFISLPGDLPPDQLIFQYLYNLSPDAPLWKNAYQYTRDVFTYHGREIIADLRITGLKTDLKERITSRQGIEKGKIREAFKRFYKSEDFQKMICQSIENSPWGHWVKDNPDSVKAFLGDIESAIIYTAREAYGAEESQRIASEIQNKSP